MTSERERYLNQLETWRGMLSALSTVSTTALFHALSEVLDGTDFLRDPVERRPARCARELEAPRHAADEGSGGAVTAQTAADEFRLIAELAEEARAELGFAQLVRRCPNGETILLTAPARGDALPRMGACTNRWTYS